MPGGVSKAQAILELKERGGFERVVSFGDAVNDIAMFQISVNAMRWKCHRRAEASCDSR